MINASYTGKRTNEDLNQPLSVQPWGFDSDKRRYFLVEGDDNCSFRVYRESNPAALYNRQWISVAGSIDEVKVLADKLAAADGGRNARKLSGNILKNIANFEEKEEKRKRREYRRQQKERFRRPEPGFSIYEGRTRGKRVKYTYSDDEDFQTDSTNRRSTRNTRNHSPAETGPVVTASGRQSRKPTRLNADTLSNGDGSAAPSVQGDMVDTEMSEAPEVGPTGRPRRAAAAHVGANGWANSRKRRRDYVSDDEEDESEPDLGDDEDEHVPQDETDDEEEFENDAMDEYDDEVAADSPGSNDSHVVKLPIKVKFDKHGKVKRLLQDETPSASTPSNMVSSPEAPNESSEDSPSDVPNYEPERTEDVVNVVPLKRLPETAVKVTSVDAKPQPTSTSSDNPPAVAPANPPATNNPASAEMPSKPTPAGPPLSSEAPTPHTVASPTSAANGSNGVTQPSDAGIDKDSKPAEPVAKAAVISQGPPTPLGLPASPSLAFRGSPEKTKTLPRVVAPAHRE